MFHRCSSFQLRPWKTLSLVGFLVLVIASVVKGQNNTVPGQPAVTMAPTIDNSWKGCVAVNEDGSIEPELVKLGEPMTICVVLASNAEYNAAPPDSTRYLRLSFRPVVDQYSRFHVPECTLRSLVLWRDLCLELYQRNIQQRRILGPIIFLWCVSHEFFSIFPLFFFICFHFI